jgi:sporulation related protein
MAILARLFNWKARPALDFQGLMRLASWGLAAAAALLVAVLSAHSQRGTITAAAAGNEGAAPWAGAAMVAQLTAHSNELENEARRLADAVTELTADRERLNGRIASLERSLEDVTGTIKRPTAASAPSATPAAATPTPVAAAAAAAPAAAQPAPTPAVSASLFAPAPLASRDQVAPNVEATEPAAPRKVAAIEPTEGKPLDLKPPEIGVDVGAAASFDAARGLWHSTRAVEPTMFEGLHPVVVVRETKARGTELRLIVGPFANQDAATRLCVALSVERRYCQPMAFEGQELSLAGPEPQGDRRASPSPPRKPAPQRTSATRPKS